MISGAVPVFQEICLANVAAAMKTAQVLLVGCLLLVDFLLLTIVIPILPTLLVNDLGVPEAAVFILFSGKAAVQIVCNLFVGPVVERHGARVPMLIGTLTIALTSAVSGLAVKLYEDDKMLWLAESKWHLFAVLAAARALQGVASAFICARGSALLRSCTRPRTSAVQRLGRP